MTRSSFAAVALLFLVPLRPASAAPWTEEEFLDALPSDHAVWLSIESDLAAAEGAWRTSRLENPDLTVDRESPDGSATTTTIAVSWRPPLDDRARSARKAARLELHAAEAELDWFEFVIRLNLTSVFMLTKAAVPHMGDGGSIVNFASQAGRDGGGPGAWAYATGKGGIQTLTRGLAKELGPSGIRVNCVCPGMIATKFHDDFTKDEVRKNVAAATPLRREGEASEVADLVTYLASPESSFLTGNSVDINGGTYFS